NEKIIQDQQFDGYYVYETNRQDLTTDEVVNLYAKQWQIEENFRTLKGSLAIRPMYLETWKHIEGYICLCFLSLVLLKFLVFKINDLTGLANKDKFTDERLINMIKYVKEIEEYFDDKIVKTTKINNDALRKYWDDYHLVKKILEKIQK
ncbi:IS1634 family transposase, partial [Mycoplasmopsis pullorum]|uniref:IS1634 family transposase n=2 Tax=Mycoplasmopsis pullorum TaxID=48003 RepID=UPI001C58B8AA